MEIDDSYYFPLACLVLRLTLSVPLNWKKIDFWGANDSKTLNINNLRTTNSKSINLHTIIKFIKYF